MQGWGAVRQQWRVTGSTAEWRREGDVPFVRNASPPPRPAPIKGAGEGVAASEKVGLRKALAGLSSIPAPLFSGGGLGWGAVRQQWRVTGSAAEWRLEGDVPFVRNEASPPPRPAPHQGGGKEQAARPPWSIRRRQRLPLLSPE